MGERESFDEVVADRVPQDLCDADGYVVFGREEFWSFMDRLTDENRREVKAARDEGAVEPCDWTDEELAQQGLVRLPTDADGVMWTGKETEFIDRDGKAHYMGGISFDAFDREWSCIDSDDRNVCPIAYECRHVPDEPADTHASLAAIAETLNDLATQGVMDDSTREYIAKIADRLRKLGGDEDE